MFEHFRVSISCLALWALLATAITALAGKPDKPPKSGGGGGTIIELNVTIADGGAISSDDHFGGQPVPYFDGSERVSALAGSDGGFRFDTTNDSQKIIDKNMKRHVEFDFAGTNGFLAVPNFPPGAQPGVDVRIGNETDPFGVKIADGKCNLSDMLPGEEYKKYARFSITFGFINGDGDEERWVLLHGSMVDDPGTGSVIRYGLPVEVVANDANADGVLDSWTITGNEAGLRRLQLGRTWSPVNQGEDSMPFVMTLERQ